MKRKRNTSRTMYRILKRKVDKKCSKLFKNVKASPVSEDSDSDTSIHNLSVAGSGNSWSNISSLGSALNVSSSDSLETLSQVGLDDLSSSESVSSVNSSDWESLTDMSYSSSHCSSCDVQDDFDDLGEVNVSMASSSETYTSWRDKLRRWAVQHQITHAALGDILKLLKSELTDLPVDPKTILKTGERVEVEVMGKGVYYNFGLKNMLSKRIITCESLPKSLQLNFNIDGVPLYKSTGKSLIPILGLLCKQDLPPFMCAIYYGPEKPSIDIFLKDFAPDLEELLDAGIEVDGKHFSVHVNAFVCDTPARAYVKKTPGHRGFYACERCTQRGQSYKNRMVFPLLEAPLRTDESFHQYSQPLHHLGISPLSDIGVPMVSKFVLDYMHLACQGLMRKLLFRWRTRLKKYKMSSKLFQIIERLMLEAAKMWPSDFNRKPRSFKDLKLWKATELRQFLLYVGAVVMKKHFPKYVYEHFLLLHAAITIFVREDLHNEFHSEAVAMVQEFVRKGRAPELYGKEFAMCNVHNLLHIGDDVKKFGALDNVSAFVFENELHRIKHMIKGTTKPLQQIVNRINSAEQVILPAQERRLKEGLVPQSEWRGGATAGMSGGIHYSKFVLNKRTISLKMKDSFAMTDDSSVISIINFYRTSDGLYAIGKRFTQYQNLYTYPIESSKLGIFIAENMSDLPRKYKISKLKCKCIAIPYVRRGAYVVYPLLNP